MNNQKISIWRICGGLMKFAIYFILAVAALSLAACKNPEIDAAATRQADDAACTDMGAVRGTEAYTNCRLALLKRRDVQDAERRAGVSQALSDLSNSIKPTYSFNNRMNCTSTPIGNTVNTNCY
jgi:hypothetical protein